MEPGESPQCPSKDDQVDSSKKKAGKGGRPQVCREQIRGRNCVVELDQDRMREAKRRQERQLRAQRHRQKVNRPA